MVRKRNAPQDLGLSLAKLGADSPQFQVAAESWLSKVRARLPDEGTAVVTVHRLPREQYLVSIRATAEGETLICEARESSLEKGFEVAGSRLLERLASASSAPGKSLSEKMREIFE